MLRLRLTSGEHVASLRGADLSVPAALVRTDGEQPPAPAVLLSCPARRDVLL